MLKFLEKLAFIIVILAAVSYTIAWSFILIDSSEHKNEIEAIKAIRYEENSENHPLRRLGGGFTEVVETGFGDVLVSYPTHCWEIWSGKEYLNSTIGMNFFLYFFYSSLLTIFIMFIIFTLKRFTKFKYIKYYYLVPLISCIIVVTFTFFSLKNYSSSYPNSVLKYSMHPICF